MKHSLPNARTGHSIFQFAAKMVAPLLLLIGLMFFSGKSFGQTSSYLGLDGGFEGSATIVNGSTNAAPVATNWTKSTATATIANETSTIRSGNNSLKVTSTSATLCRIFSPSITIAASTTKWQVQYYRRAISITNGVQNQAGNYRGGTEQASGVYNTVAAANTWEKVTYSPSATTSATSAAAHIIAKMIGTGGDMFYDDVVLYESATIDVTVPSVATAAGTSGATISSLDVSWTAASGGVDGGGYIVVRGLTDPTTPPNANGIYAVNNLIAAGMTVVYRGTGISFTDGSLSSGTQYFYRVYTYDKAYNYAAAATCNGTTSSASASYSGVTAGAGAEPATIPSTTTALTGASAPQTNAILNFDFLVTDDANTTSGNDLLPTLISQIVIPQGTGNDIADWTQAIAGAELSDGTNTLAGTVAATSITFPSINTATLGNIGDGGTKTYSLKIWLKTALGGTFPTTIDGLNLAFKIDRTNFTTASAATSTQMEALAGTVVESGSTNNAVTVVATKLNFVQQPTNVNQNATMSPSVTISANDANGNRDLGYTTAVAVSSSGSMTGDPISATPSAGLATVGAIVHTVAGTGLFLTGTSGALTATGNSTAFNVIALTPVINVTGQAHNSPYAYGSKAWGTNTDVVFTINNTGSAVMNISSLTFGGAGFAIQGATPTTVAIGSFATFTVRFTPNAIGAFTGSVTINSDASNQAAYVINFTGTGTPNTLSTITTDITYSYTQNIDYASYQSTPIPAAASGSVGVHNIIITDGADADNLPTILNAITFTYTGTANTIRTAALFTTAGSKIADVATVNPNSLVFSGLSISTGSDGGNTQAILRVTFGTTVTDNEKLVFTVTAATAASSGSSLFTSFGAVSDNIANDKNKIEVTATKLAFVQGPSNATNGASMAPAVTVKGVDANNNQDLDFATPVSVACSTPAALTSGGGPIAPSAGVATFSALVHGTDGTYTMTASASGVSSSAASSSYLISTFTYLAGDFKPKTSVGATNLSFNGDWEYNNGSGWIAVPDGKAPQNTSTTVNRIIIDKYVGGGGSTTKLYNADIIIQNGGILDITDDDVPPVASEFISAGKKIEVLSGGELDIHGDIDLASTASLIVRNGASMYIDQASMVNNHPMWDGTEKFEGGSTLVINNWNFGASSTVAALFNISTAIANNDNGWKFGNLILDVNTGANNWQMVGGGIGILNLCENDFDVSNASTTAYITGATNASGTNGFIINGNMTIYDGNFSFGSSYNTGTFSHQFTVNGNFSCASNDILKMHLNGASTATSVTGFVNVKGNFTVANTVTAFNSDKSSGNSVVSLNLNGTGTTQLLSVFPTAVAVPITVKTGASVQLSTYDLAVNSLASVTSNFTVESGATFDFNFNGSSTPLVIKKVTASPAGTNTFVSNQGSTLIITAPDGINLAASTTGATLQPINNQMNTASNINSVATFWYKGKVNQHTGTGITASSSARQVIVDLASNSLTLTPDVIFGLTNTTTISATGGKLDIRQGQFVETTAAYIDGSSGTLYMSGGTRYVIAKGDNSAALAYATPIPRMTGGSFPYILTGGTIELAGTGASHSFQVLRANTSGLYTYKYVSFTGANTAYSGGGSPTDWKGLTNQCDIDSALSISNNAVVKCVDVSDNAASFEGNGGLTMSSGWLMFKKVNTSSPRLTATNAGTSYNLTGGTIEFYGSAANQQQQIRGNYGAGSTVIDYYNLEINAAAGNYSFADRGNVDLSSSFSLQGVLNVNSPAVLKMDDADFIYKSALNTTNTVNIKSGAGLMYGSPNGITTVALGGVGTVAVPNPTSGNIRTSVRTFDANASYGFIASGDMVSGSGLPGTVPNLYAYKANTTDKVTMSNPVNVTGILNLTKGILTTSATNLLTLTTTATNPVPGSPSVSSFINGPMAWQTTTTGTEFAFPIGKTLPSIQYKPAYVLPATAAGTTTYTSEYFVPATSTATTFSGPFSGSTLMAILKDEYWDISRTGTGTARIAFDYTAATLPGSWTLANSGAGLGSFPSTALNAAVAHYYGSTYWDFTKSSGFSNYAPYIEASYYGNSSKLYSDVMSTFSPSTIGFGYTIILPIKLLSFSGQLQGTNGALSWKIADMADLSGFELQHSTDGIHFAKLANIPGNGGTQYGYLHQQLPAGVHYYRLLITEKDGHTSYSQIVPLSLGKLHTEVIGLSQTVVKNEIGIKILSEKGQTVQAVITDALGRTLGTQKGSLQPGLNQWNISTSLKAAGMYFVTIFTSDRVQKTLPFVKE